MHSQTTHLIIFTGYSDRAIQHYNTEELYTWGENQLLQQTCTTLTNILHYSCTTMWEYYDAVNEQHSQQWFNREREREEGKMEWLASGLQICLGLVVSENLLPSLRNSHTHTHTISTAPQGLKLLVQAINLKPQEKSST